jgi:hypothetical protein
MEEIFILKQGRGPKAPQAVSVGGVHNMEDLDKFTNSKLVLDFYKEDLL